MRRATVIAGLALMFVAGSSAPARAQSGIAEDAFQFRFGWFFPSGGGEVWNENEEVFTLEASDFDSFQFGMSYVKGLTGHLELGINFDWYSETVFSSYRDWVDERGFPINHDTRLERLPLTADLRWLPAGRYRSRPGGNVLRPVFYLGAGAGVNFWEYREQGDFLDFAFDPPEVFYASFRDSGEALTVYVLAGAEWPMSPSFNFAIEGRYSWSDDTLGSDFAGLGDLELGGTAIFGGLSWRF